MAAEERDMDIRIISIELDKDIEGQKKSYKGAEVIYRDSTQEVRTKNMHNNTFQYNKDLRKQLEELKAGDYVHVVSKKEGDFVNWISATKIEKPVDVSAKTETAGGATAEVPSRGQVKSNYETPEERARKQILIIRQSSISSAIAFFAASKSDYEATIENVLDVAREFEAFVLGTTITETTDVNLPI